MPRWSWRETGQSAQMMRGGWAPVGVQGERASEEAETTGGLGLSQQQGRAEREGRSVCQQ